MSFGDGVVVYHDVVHCVECGGVVVSGVIGCDWGGVVVGIGIGEHCIAVADVANVADVGVVGATDVVVLLLSLMVVVSVYCLILYVWLYTLMAKSSSVMVLMSLTEAMLLPVLSVLLSVLLVLPLVMVLLDGIDVVGSECGSVDVDVIVRIRARRVGVVAVLFILFIFFVCLLFDCWYWWSCCCYCVYGCCRRWG